MTRSLNTYQNLDDVEAIWDHLKINLLKATEEACSWTKKRKRQETWWWNNTVQDYVITKKRLWKIWKNGGDKEPYLAAKREAKKYDDVKVQTETEKFAYVQQNDVAVFKIAKANASRKHGRYWRVMHQRWSQSLQIL